MSATETARARARRAVRDDILDTARRHLAAHGAAGLSFRAVARELGMPSSGVYRYFDSRDALLTALIVESYDSLGDCAEQSAEQTADEAPRQRWVAAAVAIRRWAIDHPHEYALLYGTPVPGYAAPDDTVVPGTRVSRTLVGIVADAHRDGLLAPPPAAADPPHLQPSTTDGLAHLAATLELDLDASTMLAVLLAWTQLFGLITFELFGQTRGLIDDHEAFLRDSAEHMARTIGL
jgi:AcrR family transcriptional regulator